MNSMGLVTFVVRRVLILAVMLVVISFLIFALLYISPGNIVDVLLGNAPRTPQEIAVITAKYHLNDPFLVQYWYWARAAITGNFGVSLQSSLPVTDEIAMRLPASIFLGAYAFILTMVIGVGLGVTTALRRGSALDRWIVGATVVGLSTPAFVSGIFLIFIFAVLIHVFPAFGLGSGFFSELWHLTLPAIALALTSTAFIVKHTRASMINVIDQDYVTFARARGLSWGRVLFVYSLRNALIPVITISGITLAGLVVGAVLVETTFNLPGIGQLLVTSANSKDITVVQGVALLVAAIIVVANLLADVAYMVLDPRIRIGRTPR